MKFYDKFVFCVACILLFYIYRPYAPLKQQFSSSDSIIPMPTASQSPCITISNIGSLKEYMPLDGLYSPGASNIAFSPDDTIVAASDNNQNILFWNTGSGRQLGILKSDNNSDFPSNGLAFSPDGLLIASSNGMSLTLRSVNDLLNHKKIQAQNLQPHTAFIRNIKFSPDGVIIASRGDQGIVQLWDRSIDQVSATFQGDTGGPGDIIFSPDGETLASSEISFGDLGRIKLWDVKTKTTTVSLIGNAPLAFSPDGNTLAFSSGGENSHINLYNIKGQKVDRLLGNQLGELTAFAFSHDGMLLVSGDVWDKMKFWDVETGKLLVTKDYNGISALAFNFRGNMLASAQQGSGLNNFVYLWSVNK